VVASTLLDSELPANPGDHTVEASATGFLKATTHVTLSTADKKTVSLKLEVDPNAPVASPASASDDSKVGATAPAAQSGAGPRAALSPSPVAPPTPPSHAAAYVSWGVGLVGVGVGTTFGLIALKDKHSLSNTCTGDVCPSSSRDSVDTAKRSGNISTIAFGVGAAGLVLGTVLYFSVGGSESQTGAHGHHTFAGLEHGRALVGPGSVQLAADF
jgi:hypothetical protein